MVLYSEDLKIDCPEDLVKLTLKKIKNESVQSYYTG
jgi:hypothetical protein